MNGKANVSLDQWTVLYLEDRERKNYTPRTISVKAETFNQFIQWANKTHCHFPQDLTRVKLKQYHHFLHDYRSSQDKPYSERTMKRHLSTMRAFLVWLVKEKVILQDFNDVLALPKTRYRLPQGLLNATEMELIIDAVDIRRLSGSYRGPEERR